MQVRIKPFGVVAEVDSSLNGDITLLGAAATVGIGIESVCGGRGTCAKCRVIASGGLAPPTALEQRGLSAEDLAAGYRLACQAVVLGDVDMLVPDESIVSRVSILSDGVAFEGALEPWVRRTQLTVEEPSLEDQVEDLERVRRSWADGREVDFALGALRHLPGSISAEEGKITLLQVDDEIVDVVSGAGPNRLLGMAFDIGTTTVVGYLLDLETGEQVGVSSKLNPQTRYGDDVVSRIGYASSEANGLDTLRRVVVDAVNEIIVDALKQASAGPEDVLAMTVVGNTTMHHLFLGIDPEALARSPYVPAVTAMTWHHASELDIAIHPDAHVWVLPNIAGWVGADTVGVLLATGIDEKDEVSLAIDIGTNGEMALGSRRRLIACSTAAGPAFEGAHLSCGMRAAYGAVDRVSIDHDVHWHTVGEGAPRGVCGSGLVDLVAEMRDVGVIDPMGTMLDDKAVRALGSEALADRVSGNGRLRSFRLVDAEDGAGGRVLEINQRDVRELQLAKGAIRAGIEILLRELGVGVDDVASVYLAGAFGNYIQPESALILGMMPRFPNAEMVPVGNAAGSGAKMALLSRTARAKAEQIRQDVEYVELSGRGDFQEVFAEAMIF